MTVSVLFGSRKAGKIGELQLDATLREVHQVNNEVTQFPIEEGSDISDNIRLVPDEVSMNGFVTNSPIDILQANNAEVIEKVDGGVEIKNLKRTEVLNRVELAVDILYRISGRKLEGDQQDPQLVDIVTGLRVYRNMALQSLSIPRDRTVGQAIRFDAIFKEIKTTTSESVVIPNSTIPDRAQSTIDKGKQTPSQTNDSETTRTSIIKRTFDAAVKFGGQFGT